LTDQGISIAQLLALGGNRQLVTLAGDLAIRPGNRMTVTEAAARAGVAPPFVERIRLASGLPPAAPTEKVCTERDAESYTNFAMGVAIFGESAMLHFTRVLGAALARIAEAAIALFVVNVDLPAQETHASSVAI